MFDRIGIFLSGLCLVHCLLLPGVISFLPLVATSFLVSEEFHLWILLLVIPTTVLALWPSFRRHGDRMPALIATGGVLILVMAAMTHENHSPLMDQVLTSIGALVVAVAHIQNVRLLRRKLANAASTTPDESGRS